jgi:cytochrome c biogenesis factor
MSGCDDRRAKTNISNVTSRSQTFQIGNEITLLRHQLALLSPMQTVTCTSKNGILLPGGWQHLPEDRIDADKRFFVRIFMYFVLVFRLRDLETIAML